MSLAIQFKISKYSHTNNIECTETLTCDTKYFIMRFKRKDFPVLLSPHTENTKIGRFSFSLQKMSLRGGPFSCCSIKQMTSCFCFMGATSSSTACIILMAPENIKIYC